MTVRLDLFSKIALVVIAILLGIIALKPLFKNDPVYASPGNLDHAECTAILEAMVDIYGLVCLDKTNGNIWWISLRNGSTEFKGKLEELGKPLVR